MNWDSPGFKAQIGGDNKSRMQVGEPDDFNEMIETEHNLREMNEANNSRKSSRIKDRRSTEKKGKYTSYAHQKDDITQGNPFSKNEGTSFGGGSSCNDRSIESDSQGSPRSKQQSMI